MPGSEKGALTLDPWAVGVWNGDGRVQHPIDDLGGHGGIADAGPVSKGAPTRPPLCPKPRAQPSPRPQWMAQSLSSGTHRRRRPSAVGELVGLQGSLPHSHRRNSGTRAKCVRSQPSAPPAWQRGEMSGWGAQLISGHQDPSPAQACQEPHPAGACCQAAHGEVGVTRGSQERIGKESHPEWGSQGPQGDST